MVSEQNNTREALIKVLKKYWGFDEFRDSQKEIIDFVLQKKDVVALLPTGGGKSLCYQLPAVLMEGTCLVISPLIALMEDQVSQLTKRGIKAAYINSSLHFKDIDRILDNVIYGNIKILYLSPERLKTDLFLDRFKKMNVSFVAVDEAHCISEWGNDFRPEYRNISAIRTFNKDLSLIALTATATPEVVKDIEDQEGDSQMKYKTLPIIIGQKASKVLAGVLILVTLFYFISFIAQNEILEKINSHIIILGVKNNRLSVTPGV